MTVVIGTAGHIDHGKTALLRALTGIDADRLPEERARGMTIDVGYAHMTLPDGDVIDFVDVPGHDRLVGNMLVGAGEIDAVLLVVAADDGPRAQTLEHLGLLDALGIGEGIVVITKVDLVDDRRCAGVEADMAGLLDGTALAGALIVAVSAATGEGLDRLRDRLIDLHERVHPLVEGRDGPARLAIDRVFSIKGRGLVVTGSLRGGPLERGQSVRILPGGVVGRIRDIQERNRPTERATGGRTALNLAGIDADRVHRGMVVVPEADRDVAVSDRLLVTLATPAARLHRSVRDLRLHLGTAEAASVVGRSLRERSELSAGSVTALLRLDRPLAVLAGDRFALRSPDDRDPVGGQVIDPDPPGGPSRRRMTPDRLRALAASSSRADRAAARLDLHGALDGPDGSVMLAQDIEAALDAAALAAVADHHATEPDSAGLALADLRPRLSRALRRLVTIDARSAVRVIDTRIDRLVESGALGRDGDRLRDPTRPAGLPAPVSAAMDLLETRLAVNDPPALADAARASGCPPEGVRALETGGRIVRIDADLAYAAPTFDRLRALAVSMARERPLTPAAYRDATGTSRRYVMALLEDFGRRGLLVRTDAGHVPGPRASQP